ncbi:MAG: metallophosphoesterase [Ignavibacteria bacterium]|nr:metallophosphoesterase [Ignavibacteria bacterium]
MKIIHISDPHICLPYDGKNLYKTIELFNHLKNEEFDHLVITGDISHTSNKDDFMSFREVLEKYGLLDSKKATIVIGKHDIFGGVVTAEDVINFPGNCRKTNFNRKVREFYGYFKELYDDCLFPGGETYYPFIKKLDNTVLIGLNSVAPFSLIKNPMASNGKISKLQINDLKNLIKRTNCDGLLKIALVHHHFSKYQKDTKSLNNPFWGIIEKSTMKLKDKKRIVKQLLKLGIKMVLHGHLHKANFYEKKNIMFVNAADAIDNNYPETIKYQKIETGETIDIKEVIINLNFSEYRNQADERFKKTSIAENLIFQ